MYIVELMDICMYDTIFIFVTITYGKIIFSTFIYAINLNIILYLYIFCHIDIKKRKYC